MTIDFDPLARREVRRATRWYARRSPAVAARFVTEVDRAIAQIAAAPQSWPLYLHGTRVYRLGRFPFLLVYRELAGVTRIIAIAHTSRRPGYSRRRNP